MFLQKLSALSKKKISVTSGIHGKMGVVRFLCAGRRKVYFLLAPNAAHAILLLQKRMYIEMLTGR